VEWFAVRHVIATDGAFEERITLWRAGSAEDAISRAEDEVAEYTEAVGGRPLDLLQSYQLADEPADGAEVFSLIRRSDLEPGAYLDSFFDTGQEIQQDARAD
jgi:hypothetical protein